MIQGMGRYIDFLTCLPTNGPKQLSNYWKVINNPNS
jgi:hypothetical protein